MIADIGTKALASTRLELLKEMLGMKKTGHVEVEDAGKNEEKGKKIPSQPQGPEVATLALRLITLAATLQMSKAMDDEEEESSAEFNQLMMIYTILVVMATLGPQALWKVGVSSACSSLRNWLLGGEGRSLPAEPEEPEVRRPNIEELTTSMGRAEDGSGRGALVQLAQAGWRHAVGSYTVDATAVPGLGGDPPLSRAEDGSGQRVLVQLAQASPGLAVEETALPGPTQNVRSDASLGQAGPSTEPSSSSGSGETSDSMAERIEATIRTIAEEEVELWREYGRMGHFPYVNENHQDADLGFDVFRTPCGTVYHSTRACTELKGPRTGFARKFSWCELCKEVGMRTRGRPPPGSPLLLLTSGQTLHTDARCPRTENTSEFRGCMYCTDFPG